MRSSMPGTSSRLEWLCALEIDKPYSQRRSPLREHIFVTRTLTKPGPDLDARVRTDKKWMAKAIRIVRYDLMPADCEPGGIDMPFTMPGQKKVAIKAEQDLRARLSDLGYTVNGNSTVWRLYVIELVRDRAERTKASCGYVYVGQTSIPIAERAQQHKLGPAYAPGYTKFSRICHKHFGHLRLDLLPQWGRETFFSRCDALQAEGRLRLHFEKAGYKVEGGTELFGNKRHECGQLRR